MTRNILIIRHGTKNELSNRFDLPLLSSCSLKNYCQDKNTFNSKLKKLRKSPNKKIIYTSPFLRTKQTAGRFAKKLKYTDSIIIDDNLGEAFDQVSKQLSMCEGKSVKYRVAKSSPSRIDKCMKNLSKKEMNILKKSQSELKKYKFSKKRITSISKIKSKNDHDRNFKKSLKRILKNNPNKDVIIVTHGRNVRNSAQMLSPRKYIPRVVSLPPTCSSFLFEQDGKNIKLVDSNGIMSI